MIVSVIAGAIIAFIAFRFGANAASKERVSKAERMRNLNQSIERLESLAQSLTDTPSEHQTTAGSPAGSNDADAVDRALPPVSSSEAAEAVNDALGEEKDGVGVPIFSPPSREVRPSKVNEWLQ